MKEQETQIYKSPDFGISTDPDDAFIKQFQIVNHQLANDQGLSPEDKQMFTELRDEMLVELIWLQEPSELKA